MKLIDRYILRTFLTPLFYCLAAFLMLYVVYDLFDHLKEFIHAKTPFSQILRYYVLILPAVALYIVPISLLLSILYSLSQLTRHNEITAMRASGISIYRLIVPLVFMGVSASLLVGLINETVAPGAAYWTSQFVREQKHKGKKDVHTSYNLPFKNVQTRRVWLIGEFNTKSFDMKEIRLIQQDEEDRDVYQIQAQSGQWLDGRWWFTDVSVQRYDNWGNPKGPPRYELRREMADLTETPTHMLNEIKDPEFLSARDLHSYIQAHQHLSDDTLARFNTNFHQRIASPWTCLVVALMGIPFGTHTGRKGALAGISLCIALFFSYYVLTHFSIALGKSQVITPWIAAWSSNILFLVVAIVFIYRMR